MLEILLINFIFTFQEQHDSKINRKKLDEALAQQGGYLITTLRKNTKKRILSAFEKFFLDASLF